jgi:hypothetical protein
MTLLRTHACGASFTLEEWFALPYVGTTRDDVVILEQRNCPCGSTLALPIAYENTPEGRDEAELFLSDCHQVKVNRPTRA